MLRIILLGAAASLSFAACAPMDDDMDGQAGMAMTGDMTPTERTAFVEMAAASDLFEIQSSQLALSRSQNTQVRQFAQTMITHHTNLSQQLMAAAQAAGLPPMTARLLPPQAAAMQRLDTASNFDRAYAREQVTAHEMALALHQNYAARGDVPALQAVSSAAVPVVSSHLQEARNLPR